MASSLVIHQIYLFAAFAKNSVCFCEKTIESFILKDFIRIIYIHNSKARLTCCPSKEEDLRGRRFNIL